MNKPCPSSPHQHPANSREVQDTEGAAASETGTLWEERTHHHLSFSDPSEKGYFNNQKICRHEASSHLFDRGFVSAGNGLVLGLVNEDVCWRSCRDEHPRAERGSHPGRARPLPVLLPWQPPQPAFPWLLTHELNVRLMQMYSSHFCLGCIC